MKIKLIIVVILVLSVGGYFYYNNPTRNIVVKDGVTTYNSSAHGYSFSYNPEYYIFKNDSLNSVFLIKKDKEPGFYTENIPDIKIEVFDSMSKLPHWREEMTDISDYFAKNGSEGIINNITSDGKEKFYFTDNGILSSYVTLFLTDNKYYQITYVHADTGDKLSPEELQVSNSFALTLR